MRQIWWTEDLRSRERDWAQVLAEWLADVPVMGFGASDSPLRSHLFYSRRRPSFERFQQLVARRHGDHAARQCTVLPRRGIQPG